MNAKPSEAMLAVLRELATPGAKAHYMRWTRDLSSYFFLSTTMKNCTKQIEGLRARGLVDWVPKGKYGDGHCVINAAGRAALEESKTAAASPH